MSETQDTKTRRRSKTSDAEQAQSADEAFEANAEKLRRDHFPVEPGDNQQDMDITHETANPSGMSEQSVKWPEVDSQEAMDAKLDEEQTDKDKQILEAAHDADRRRGGNG